GGQARERHALLEVQQVEREFLRGVPGGETSDEGEEEICLSRTAGTTDEGMRCGVTDHDVHRFAFMEADRSAQFLGRTVCAELDGEEVVEGAGTTLFGDQRLGDTCCGLGDLTGGQRGIE